MHIAQHWILALTYHWYALRSKPRKEEIVWRQLQARRMEVFYPRIRVKPINPRARKIRPYFPGYLFARADLDLVGLSTFQYMPYAIGIVCFDGEPAPVPDSLIHALIKRLETLREVGGHLFDGFAKGDPLQIREGPFEGYSAIFDARLSGTERVKVLLELLSGKYMSLELDAAYLKRT